MLGQQTRRRGALPTGQRPPRPALGAKEFPKPPGVVLVNALHSAATSSGSLTFYCPRAGQECADPLILITPGSPGQQPPPQFLIHAVISRSLLGSGRPDARSSRPLCCVLSVSGRSSNDRVIVWLNGTLVKRERPSAGGNPSPPNRLRALLDGDGLSFVTSERIGGAFAALGAVIGSGAALASGLIGNRTQRNLANATRNAQIADVRRAAYAENMTSVYSFMDRARELIAQLENEPEMSECDVARHAYCDDWERLQPTYAPVLIAGPAQIEEAAETLRYHLGDLADKCDGWYTARKNGRQFCSGEIEKVTNAQLAARDARSNFASAARDHVYE